MPNAPPSAPGIAERNIAMNVPLRAPSKAARPPDPVRSRFRWQMNDLGPGALSNGVAVGRHSKEIAMPRAQYFVTQSKGEWKVRAGYRYSGPYPSRREALRAAIDFAERDGQAGRAAEVLVQGPDRLFRPAWTYGRDPYPIAPRSAQPASAGGHAAKSG
jgi:Uncharacterized protein conserved in bacteria (DUF2188)